MIAHQRPADILDCLANLSSDEVFTPPRVANRMLDLLPDAVWTDPDLRWLDPGSKSGVFLREAERRLMDGLEAAIPNERARREHILRNMLFGLAITELTALISRRTLYHCRFANNPSYSVVRFGDEEGNIRFPDSSHEWNTQGACMKCGASRSALIDRDGREAHAYPFLHMPPDDAFEEEDMRFDIIMGNPPYQLDDAGHGKSARPLYHRFVQAAKALEPRYLTFVIPARWYTGGKGLDQFRREMLADRRLHTLVDYTNMKDLFEVGVDIAGGGGGCYFLWDREHDGPCLVVPEGDSSRAVRRRLGARDVFVRDHVSERILEKVSARADADGLAALEDCVWGRNPFGVPAHKVPADAATEPTSDRSILLATREGDRYVERHQIAKNREALDKWKVTISRFGTEHAGNPDAAGQKRVLTDKARVLPPDSACTETYLIAGVFPEEAAAAARLAYLKTKFCRFLLSLRIATQQINRSSFAFVPAMPTDRVWTDDELYAHFELGQDEIAHIESLIREMPG